MQSYNVATVDYFGKAWDPSYSEKNITSAKEYYDLSLEPIQVLHFLAKTRNLDRNDFSASNLRTSCQWPNCRCVLV